MESEHHWGHRQFPVMGEDTGLVIQHFCTGGCVPWMGDAVWGSDFDHAGRAVEVRLRVRAARRRASLVQLTR